MGLPALASHDHYPFLSPCWEDAKRPEGEVFKCMRPVIIEASVELSNHYHDLINQEKDNGKQLRLIKELDDFLIERHKTCAFQAKLQDKGGQWGLLTFSRWGLVKMSYLMCIYDMSTTKDFCLTTP